MKILDSVHYQVFAGPQFKGNPVIVNLVELAATHLDMLEHARTLPNGDHLYYYPSAESDLYHVHVCSHYGEVFICGHALLAAAQHLHRISGHTNLRLNTNVFTHRSRWYDQRLWLALPTWAWQNLESPLLRGMLEDAGVPVIALLQSRWNVWIAITDTPETVAGFVRENFPWHKLSDMSPGALILSAAQNDNTYCYRYFSPWFGKPEDSATGSAHCYLAPYWLRNDAQTYATQLSPEGKATMQIQLDGEQVWLSGRVDKNNII